MTQPTARADHRFVVDEHGPRFYGVRDTRTQLTVHDAFTRRAAEAEADRLNATRTETPQESR